jgi:hypothetical protein
VVDVLESEDLAASWSEKMGYTVPILLDGDGTVSATYAPEGVQPDLARDQVPIAGNLIVDKAGTIQFYSLLDSVNFDARLVGLKAKLDELLSER